MLAVLFLVLLFKLCCSIHLTQLIQKISRNFLLAMEHGSLTEGSLVLYERAEQNKTLQMPLLMPISSKRYGSTHIDLLRVEGVEQ